MDSEARGLIALITLGLPVAGGCRALFDIDVTYEGTGGGGGEAVGGGGQPSGGGGGEGGDCAAACDFDDFDSALTSCWSRFNEGEADVFEIDRSTLHIVPLPGSSWNNQNTGPLQYQDRGGDFLVAVTVAATNLTGDDAPEPPFNRAGIVVRDPDPGHPGTWIEWGVGRWGDSSLGAFAQRGQDGSSGAIPTNHDASIDVTDAALAVCRVGDQVRLLVWDDDRERWEGSANLDWAPTGDSQVGLYASGAAVAAIDARFDAVRFLPAPADLAGCGDALPDPDDLPACEE